MAGEPITRRRPRAITVRPNQMNDKELIAPIDEEVGEPENHGKENENVVETDGIEKEKNRADWEQLQDQMEDLNVRVARHFEDANDENKWQPPMIESPPQPTKEEWLQHQLIHTPYAAWCRHCIAARAVRANHQCAKLRAKIVLDTDNNEIGPIKISMDYMYMHERMGQYAESRWNPPYLVVVEHRYGRAWAYQTPNKGPNDEANCVPEKLIQDWDNCGSKDVRLQLKADQEPSMIRLQEAIQSLRLAAVIPVNSPVGESESNGRVEDAIRRVQEKIRALRHQLETNIKMKIID